MRFNLFTLRTLCALLLTAATVPTWAQTLTHGPATGGVGPDSARVYVRTSAPASVTVEVSSDNFATVAASANATTVASADNAVIVTLKPLQAYTLYRVRVKVAGVTQAQQGSFRTAPVAGQAGTYKFLSGSCIGNLVNSDSALFKRAETENADMMFYYGDWGYPDEDNDALRLVYPFLSNPFNPPAPTSYAATPALITEAYKKRYASTNSGNFNRNIALAYVYDDHDYLNDNSGSNFAGGYFINRAFQPYAPAGTSAVGAPLTVPMPASARRNVIKAYAEQFPGYSLPDTSRGIYHSFKYGNCEFFMLDTRANRSPQQDNIKEVTSGNWQLVEQPNNTMLGTQQLNWLLNGLRNSTADWKFIITSVTYNVGNKPAFDSVLAAGNNPVPILGSQLSGLPIQPTGYIIASRYADKWVGYPTEMQTLLDAVVSPSNPANAIKNVFMVSGDTHNSALDDGTFSGIPELMAGQLLRSNRREARENQDFVGFNIWNKGGSGLCENDNYSTNYGKIEVYGRDSVRLSAVDAAGNEIFGHTFAYNEPYKWQPNHVPNRQPTPQADAFTVNPTGTQALDVLANDTDPDGDQLYVLIKELPQSGTLVVNTQTNKLDYTPDQPGNYAFTYKVCDRSNPDCPNCKDQTATLNVQNTAGVNPNQQPRTAFEVFPNPANTLVTVRVAALTSGAVAPAPGTAYTIQVLNMLGQTLRTHSFTGTETLLDVSTLPGGNYLWRIVDANGTQHQTGKLNVLHY